MRNSSLIAGLLTLHEPDGRSKDVARAPRAFYVIRPQVMLGVMPTTPMMPPTQPVGANRYRAMMSAGASIWLCLIASWPIAIATLVAGGFLPNKVGNVLLFLPQLAFPSSLNRPFGPRVPLWMPVAFCLVASLTFAAIAWKLRGMNAVAESILGPLSDRDRAAVTRLATPSQ
jgi:hypothetical protein